MITYSGQGRWSLVILAVVMMMCIASAKPPRAEKQPKNEEAVAAIRSALERVMMQLRDSGELMDADREVTGLFDQAIIYAPNAEKKLFRDLAYSKRLIRFLQESLVAGNQDIISYLLNNPDFTRELVFGMRFGVDIPEQVMAIVMRLQQYRGKQLNTYATLAAAICLVHDRPMKRHINIVLTSPDPIALFDYYASNERRMVFGIREVPTELLIHVVDSIASIDDMHWALGKYAGDTQVGARFFDIEYDYDHYLKGDTKKVMKWGYTLPNILRYGGVCADQAYFAMSVGKSIGVPAIYTVGRSSEVSHAWVGFLQADRRGAWWNFDTGRYEAYQGLRGNVFDPQTREMIPDSHISLLAETVHATTLDRHYVAAMTDAARRLGELADVARLFKVSPIGGEETKKLREATKDDQLAMLEAGLRVCPGYADGWITMRNMAAAGELTLDDKRRWADVLDKLCGKRYPDFYLTILTPMIQSVEDVEEQNELWNAAFQNFRGRADLAAAVRMDQAAMWKKHRRK